jgi:hypothetical protein
VHHDYREIPALAAYIDRIGAEQLNFKRFMVRTWFGAYYKERTVISLDTTTGKITCKDPEFKPSEAEASAIKDAIQGANFPKPVEAPNLDTLFDQHPELRRATLYTFWNRDTGLIKMVQERRMTDKGKAYIPWTGWSDGDWRPMEPEGDLPFWKPKTKRSNLIMVHEGAKVAAAVEDLIASGADHPWLGTLKMYEHWGLIGGALGAAPCGLQRTQEGRSRRSRLRLRQRPAGRACSHDLQPVLRPEALWRALRSALAVGLGLSRRNAEGPVQRRWRLYRP